MNGYMMITDPAWLTFLQAQGLKNAVFWRKRKSFKAIEIGEPIYFLRRGKFESWTDRFILGRGLYKANECLTAEKAWERFGIRLGYRTKKDFLNAVYRIYKDVNPQLGCISLCEVSFYSNAVSLASAKVEFSPYTVSGRKLSQEECSRIDEKGCL